MTLRNDRSLGVINGSRGVIESVDFHAGQLEVRLDDERIVTLPTEYLEAGHLTHAYAITGHKAQGMTTDRAFVLGDDSLYREWGYVAMSRGPEANRLYVVMGDGCDRDEVGGAVERPYQVDQLVRSLERSRAKSLAFDPNGDIAEKDSKSLRREQEAIYERLSGGPRDPRDKLIHVRQETERLRYSLEQERRQAIEAEEKLTSMGAIAKARRRVEVESLRRRINGYERSENNLTEKLRSLADQEKELAHAQQQWDRWTREQSPLVARVEEVESELERRNRATLRDRESNLPKYLETCIGAVPQRPSEKHEWRKAVSAIEGYRERYGITDEKRALGPEPRTSDQRWEKEQVERHIEERNDRRNGRSRDDDVGIERSFSPTP